MISSPEFDFAPATDPRVAAFELFHENNPQVYELFKHFAREAAARLPRFSADAILHRIRWWVAVETHDPAGWKINDHWSAFYARLLIKDDPGFAGFFELRRSAADRRAA